MSVTGMTESPEPAQQEELHMWSVSNPQQYGKARRECAAVSKGNTTSYSDCLRKKLKEQSLKKKNFRDDLFPESYSKVQHCIACLTLKPTKQRNVRCLKRTSEQARHGAMKPSICSQAQYLHESVQSLIKTNFQVLSKRRAIWISEIKIRSSFKYFHKRSPQAQILLLILGKDIMKPILYILYQKKTEAEKGGDISNI